MFKKTLLAAAISAFVFNATAASNAITGVTASLEGSVGAASITVPDSVVTLASEYTVGDTVTFTVSGAEFDVAGSTPVVTAALLSSDTAVLGLLSSTANSATFRITSQTDGAANGVVYTDGTFTLSGMVLTTATVIDAVGDVSITYSASTSQGLTIDSDVSGSNTDVAISVVEQFTTSTTTPADGVIDVENGRQQFTSGPLIDTIVFTPAEATAAVNDATYTGATHVVYGDFTWMESDDDAGIDAGELATAYAMTGATDDTFVSTIDSAGTMITSVATDGGGSDVEAHTATFTVLGEGVDGAPIIATQTFTVNTTVAYTNQTGAETKALATGAAAGAWTLNGASFTVNYIPFGPNTFPILNVQHTGTVAGAIEVEYLLEGGSTWITLAMNGLEIQPGLTNLKAPVMDAITAAVLADSGDTSGKVAVQITVNAPKAQISGFAGFKVKHPTTLSESRIAIGTYGQLGTSKNAVF